MNFSGAYIYRKEVDWSLLHEGTVWGWAGGYMTGRNEKGYRCGGCFKPEGQGAVYLISHIHMAFHKSVYTLLIKVRDIIELHTHSGKCIGCILYPYRPALNFQWFRVARQIKTQGKSLINRRLNVSPDEDTASA